jgi:hypothetical protein
VLLGRVIAHGIGHVLLPNQKHAPNGIMRANLESEYVGFFSFTREQAASIRAAIHRLRASHDQADGASNTEGVASRAARPNAGRIGRRMLRHFAAALNGASC